MKKLFLLVISAFVLGATAQAGTPGGSDFCGLGWQITNKKTMIATTTRATTNAVVPPTFGMTTGTIGCDQHPIALRDIPAAQFVATNYDALLLDMAQGEGEVLAAFASAVGCSDPVSFGEMTRKEFSALTDGADSMELLRRVQNKTKALNGCSA
jgi:hypothetical protein